MKRIFMTGLTIGLLVIACDSPPRTTDDNGKDDTSVEMADAGSEMQDADATNLDIPDSGMMMVSADVGLPDSGVDFTRDPSCPSSASWVTTVSGQVTDEEGSPIENAWAQLCLMTDTGSFVCLNPVDTIADGSFEVLVPVQLRCLVEMTMRSLVSGQNRATMYCHLGLESAQSAYQITNPLKLYPTVAAISLPPEGDKEMVRTVGFADGFELSMAPKYFYGEYTELAAAVVAPTGLCFVEDPSEVDVLYAFSPEGTAGVDFSTDTIREIGLKMPIPSGQIVSAGDKYDFYVLGGLGCPDPTTAMPGSNFIKEGEWAKFGTGTVNSTADKIESDVGVGIPCLTWLKAEKQ